MRKLLGMLMCACACLVLGVGAPGCTKKKTEEKTKTETMTKGDKTETTTTKTTKTEMEPAKKWTVKAPADVTITQGETAKVAVNITREKYSDPVDVSFSGLPEGVTVMDEPKMIAKDAASADFTLKAAPDAKVVENHKVTVTTSGAGMKHEETFKVTVKKK